MSKTDGEYNREIKPCPICKSENVSIKRIRNAGAQSFVTISCDDCSHSISGTEAKYIVGKWNTDKESLIEYTYELLSKNPFTVYVNDYAAKVWGGVSELCKHLSKSLGVKVVHRRPDNFKGGGYILDAMYEERLAEKRC